MSPDEIQSLIHQHHEERKPRRKTLEYLESQGVEATLAAEAYQAYRDRQNHKQEVIQESKGSERRGVAYGLMAVGALGSAFLWFGFEGSRVIWGLPISMFLYGLFSLLLEKKR